MDHQAEPGRDTPAGGATAAGEIPAGSEHAAAEQAGAAGRSSVPETGEPRVDAALDLLSELPGLPVTEHAAVFERVHAELTDVLGELDPESGGTDG